MTDSQLKEVLKTVNQDQPKKINEKFDDEAQKEFLKGAKIAYETIITDFSDNDNKIIASKPLLNNQIYNQFNQALKDRSSRGHFAEITFIGVKIIELNFKIFVPTLCFTWFVFHLVEGFYTNNLINKSMDK